MKIYTIGSMMSIVKGVNWLLFTFCYILLNMTLVFIFYVFVSVCCIIFIIAAMTMFSFCHHSSWIVLFKQSLALCRILILGSQEYGNPSKGLNLKLLQRRFWERLTLGWVWFSIFSYDDCKITLWKDLHSFKCNRGSMIAIAVQW